MKRTIVLLISLLFCTTTTVSAEIKTWGHDHRKKNGVETQSNFTFSNGTTGKLFPSGSSGISLNKSSGKQQVSTIIQQQAKAAFCRSGKGWATNSLANNFIGYNQYPPPPAITPGANPGNGPQPHLESPACFVPIEGTINPFCGEGTMFPDIPEYKKYVGTKGTCFIPQSGLIDTFCAYGDGYPSIPGYTLLAGGKGTCFLPN
jgi:hypothetical protein